MKRILVIYALLEAVLVTLFVWVLATHGLSVWAYWALAGVFVLSLILGVMVLVKSGKGKEGK